MQNSTQDLLGSTFLTVVEQLTFMFGEPVPKADLEVDGVQFTMARMNFSGDLPGSLSLVVPAKITTDIAANILGLDIEDIESEEMELDALSEMLNVVCGHVIMALAGSGANFRLESPETIPVDADLCKQMMLDDDLAGFLLDEYPVLFGFTPGN